MSETKINIGPLEALAARYDRLAARGEAPVLGFAPVKISFALVLDLEGRVVAVHDERIGDGKKKYPKVVEAPQPPKRTVAVVSGLLWDKTSYALGVTRFDPSPNGARSAKLPTRAAAEHRVFKAFQSKVLARSEDHGARALLAFLSAWTPDQYVELAYAEEMLDQNIAFKLDGDQGFLHDRPALSVLVASQAESDNAPIGQCLIRGQIGGIARLHPSIKGVLGAQTTGASLVSFNGGAFTSYGKVQGDNAPTSELAAFGYGTALNDLLTANDGIDSYGRIRYRNRVQIADATTVFWVDAPDDEAVEGEALLNQLFGDEPTLSAGDQKNGRLVKIRGILRDLQAGGALSAVAKNLDAQRVFVLGLSPNVGRLSVRFWKIASLGELASRFQQHWKDLNLAPSRHRAPPSVWRLLRELTGRDGERNFPPNLAGELARSIFTGEPYPGALLAFTLMRIRSDHGGDKINHDRVAMLKAVITRQARRATIENPSIYEDMLVSLDPTELNPGYRLGRLFAIMEAAQAVAIQGVGASIRDRFYGSASATPARVFPLLLRGLQNHLSKIRKSKPGLAMKYERALTQVADGLAGALPTTLDMESQGRFAIGYYHQRGAIYATRADGEEPASEIPDEIEEK